MAATPVTLEVRYRLGGLNAAWTVKRFPAQDTTVTLHGVTRESLYEIQARYIGDNGVPSAWVPVTVVVGTGRTGVAAYPPGIAAGTGIWLTGMPVNWSASPTSATISVAAGTLQLPDQTIAYNASSGSVAGTAGQTVTYHLYYDDPQLQGGARTLGITTDVTAAKNGYGRVYITDVPVTFPVSGTGSGGGEGGGGSGGGGGGSCVAVEAWVIRRGAEGAELVQAGTIVVGDCLRVVDPVSGAERWGVVSMSHAAPAERVTVTVGGASLTCSTTAPLGGLDGPVLAPDATGARLARRIDGVFGHGAATVAPAAPGLVQHITCENDYFLAGDAPHALLAHHNLKQAQ